MKEIKDYLSIGDLRKLTSFFDPNERENHEYFEITIGLMMGTFEKTNFEYKKVLVSDILISGKTYLFDKKLMSSESEYRDKMQTLIANFFKNKVISYILNFRNERWLDSKMDLLCFWMDTVFDPNGDRINKTMNTILYLLLIKYRERSYAEVLYIK
jgi:hypothetical protein